MDPGGGAGPKAPGPRRGPLERGRRICIYVYILYEWSGISCFGVRGPLSPNLSPMILRVILRAFSTLLAASPPWSLKVLNKKSRIQNSLLFEGFSRTLENVYPTFSPPHSPPNCILRDSPAWTILSPPFSAKVLRLSPARVLILLSILRIFLIVFFL